MKPLAGLKQAIAATGRMAPILRSGLIAGVAVAAVTYPLAAVAGISMRAGTELYQNLPQELISAPPAQTTYVYAADGKTLLTMFYEEHRKYTPISEMSERIQQAIVAAEDGRFYDHHGVDGKGIARAFVANQSAGEVSQGASTLTMQYVRMALRDSAGNPDDVIAATEQTTARKLREMKLAIHVEHQLGKTQILERYLNVAYFGHRAYGIFAASQIFFSKLPKDLSITEAATLAGLVKAPTAYDPAVSDRAAAKDRRNYVIDRMVALGYITATEGEKAKAEPIRLNVTDPPNDCVSVPAKYNSWGFFCDFLKNWWLEQSAFGENPSQRLDRLRRGGYRITTSIDAGIQKAAQRHVVRRERIGSSFALGTVVVQPGTGLIKAMAINRNYSLDQKHNGPHTDHRRAGKVPSNYPNTVNPLLGGGDLPGYQAGSTFKMFTMLAALDSGMKLNTWIYAPHRYRSQFLAGDGERGSCGGRWCPSNASGAMTGRHGMHSGFGKSVNTYFVQLEQKVGTRQAVRMAERLGLTWRSDVDREMASAARVDTWGSFTLGVADTTPLEMANAYATVAAQGKYCEPLPVTEVIGPDGKAATRKDAQGQEVPVAAPRCRQVVRPAVAQAAADAARCVTGYRAAKGNCGGWSTAPQVYPMVGRPVAGKTGTTDDTRAAWFVGFTPQLAAASFMADPDNPFHLVGDWNSNKPIEAVALTLRDALRGEQVVRFTAPPSSIVGRAPASQAPSRSGRRNR